MIRLEARRRAALYRRRLSRSLGCGGARGLDDLLSSNPTSREPTLPTQNAFSAFFSFQSLSVSQINERDSDSQREVVVAIPAGRASCFLLQQQQQQQQAPPISFVLSSLAKVGLLCVGLCVMVARGSGSGHASCEENNPSNSCQACHSVSSLSPLFFRHSNCCHRAQPTPPTWHPQPNECAFTRGPSLSRRSLCHYVATRR